MKQYIFCLLSLGSFFFSIFNFIFCLQTKIDAVEEESAEGNWNKVCFFKARYLEFHDPFCEINMIILHMEKINMKMLTTLPPDMYWVPYDFVNLRELNKGPGGFCEKKITEMGRKILDNFPYSIEVIAKVIVKEKCKGYIINDVIMEKRECT